MHCFRLGLLVLVLVGIAGCEDKEKLCRAIGETRESALQPRDRIYWQENCVGRTSVSDADRERWRAEAAERDAAAKASAKRAAETNARLARLAEPLVAAAGALHIGDKEPAVLAATKSLSKPTVSRDKDIINIIWRLEQGFDRCKMLARHAGPGLPPPLRRVEVTCKDELAGTDAPVQTVLVKD